MSSTTFKDFKGRTLEVGDRIIVLPHQEMRWDNTACVWIKVINTSFIPRYGIVHSLRPRNATVTCTFVGENKIGSYYSLDVLKVPNDIWFNDERLKAYLLLEGLGERFNLTQ